MDYLDKLKDRIDNGTGPIEPDEDIEFGMRRQRELDDEEDRQGEQQ